MKNVLKSVKNVKIKPLIAQSADQDCLGIWRMLNAGVFQDIMILEKIIALNAAHSVKVVLILNCVISAETKIYCHLFVKKKIKNISRLTPQLENRMESVIKNVINVNTQAVIVFNV